MEEILKIGEGLDIAKQRTLNLDKSEGLSKLTNALTDSSIKCIGSMAKYVIKAMPVADGIKDVLIDIKNDVIKGKSIKDVLNTAIKSTIREGLEYVGFSGTNITKLMELKEVAQKGGIVLAIKDGFQIVANNYLKNKIVGNHVYSFFEELSKSIQSNEFMKKLENILKKLDEKKDLVVEKIKQWYKSYEDNKHGDATKLANEISNSKEVLKYYSDCAKDNAIIQVATKNMGNEKISLQQLQLCKMM